MTDRPFVVGPQIELIVAPRGGGKSTRLLEWMRAAPEGEHRVCVSHTSDEAMRLYRSTFDTDDNPTWAESWQFIGANELFEPGWSGAVLRGRAPRIVIGVDNLDLILSRIFGWDVGAITLTAPESAR